MLAAVTEFKRSVEGEARERALIAQSYRHRRAALAKTATRIWRDPAAAIAKIEELLMRGIAGERIGAAVSNDPAAYGATRGSDRMIDKMRAAGRERKEALQALPEAADHVRTLATAFASALYTETHSVTNERRAMAVPIPALSKTAEYALRRLAMEMKRSGIRADMADDLIDPSIRHELAAVNRALDERFGKNAILRGDKDVVNRVSPVQFGPFEAMRGAPAGSAANDADARKPGDHIPTPASDHRSRAGFDPLIPFFE